LSYILDALKKADADRERAAVPGLHARPQDALASDSESRRAPLWPVLAGATIVVLGGTLAWVLLSQPEVRVPPLPESPPPSPQPLSPPAAAPAPAATPPVAAALPTVSEPTPTVVLPPPAPASPPPAPQRAAPPPAAAVPAPAPAARVPTLAELPAELRATLPPLAISGAVYSPTPSARLLFIGGQVLKEGDAVANGIVVEQIGVAASVLSVRGQRFQISH
jgi:general secretion pathway protein B